MYRGPSFLLQYDYTIHLGVIGVLAAPQFEPLWKAEFGSGQNDAALRGRANFAGFAPTKATLGASVLKQTAESRVTDRGTRARCGRRDISGDAATT
jgi:hypothetical protein